MKQNVEFKLKWKRKGKVYQTIKETEKVLAPFEGLVIGFSDDNENSKKLIHVLPVVSEIFIDLDSVKESKTMIIVCAKENGEKCTIPIDVEKHKIVYAIWNGYCMEGEEVE